LAYDLSSSFVNSSTAGIGKRHMMQYEQNPN